MTTSESCIIHVSKLDDWFAKKLGAVKLEHDTCAYIVGVLSKFRSASEDLSKCSIVIEYSEARASGNFSSFQKIGDWVLWMSITNPEHIAPVSEVVETIGMLSYNSCYRIVKYQWPVYEELAGDLPRIAREARSALLRLFTNNFKLLCCVYSAAAGIH